MYVISKKTLQRVKESKECRIRLGYEFQKVSKTIDDWVEKNAPILTTATAQKIIKEELGLPDTENILEEA